MGYAIDYMPVNKQLGGEPQEIHNNLCILHLLPLLTGTSNIQTYL